MGTGSLCPGFRRHGINLGALNMRTTFLKTCGVSIAALALGLSLATTPVMAAGEHRVGGGGGFHGGGSGGFHGGAAPFTAAAAAAFMVGAAPFTAVAAAVAAAGTAATPEGAADTEMAMATATGCALGLGLLGGAIIGSQYPYYDSGYGDEAGYDSYPQDGGGDSSAYCARTFRSYDPASGTYLGYDGLRHPCP